MVKVGDKVKLVGRLRGWCDDRNFGRYGIVTGIGGNYADVVFEGDDTLYKRDYGNIAALEVIHDTPPQKITKNSYEYELVEPVKPEWLVDGVWVVDKYSKEKYHIIEGEPGNYRLLRSGSNHLDRDIGWIESFTRPHAASDWKWGDWAMYGNDRVFVIRVGSHGTAVITRRSSDSVFDYVPVSELTPTF